jgi:molecular chaperone GrpE
MTNTVDKATTEPSPAEANGASASSETPNELVKTRQERDEYLDLARRTKAEFDNYQKRMAREREQSLKYAYAPLAKDLLPAIDNLDRFLTGVKQDNELTRIVALVRNQLVDAFKKHGITTIAAQGQPFDPNLHEAISLVPSADVPPQTVMQVVEAGYQNQDRVLRPAKVIVSQGVG